jgi:hypothetical protein
MMRRQKVRVPYRAATLPWFARLGFVGLGFVGLAAPAVAAPFCVQTMAVPPQCIFFDAASCQQRATQMGGTCTANPDEIQVQAEQGRYCVVTSEHVASCMYVDENSCDTEAKHAHAVCVEAQNRPEAPDVDPYRDIRPGQTGSVAPH